MVKAVRLDMAEELHYRILSVMFGEDRRPLRVNFGSLAKTVGVSEAVIRYNVKKLLKLGYIRVNGDGYEPTEKILFLKKK